MRTVTAYLTKLSMTVKSLLIVVVLIIGASGPETSAQALTETLKVKWPEEYHFKVGADQTEESVHVVDYIPENESIEDWTILANTMSLQGIVGTPMDKMMEIIRTQTLKTAADAKLTFLEKDTSNKYPWILFMVETPKFDTDSKPESQLFFIRQGVKTTYITFVAVKQPSLSKPFIDKWSAVFKSSEVVFQ